MRMEYCRGKSGGWIIDLQHVALCNADSVVY